MEKLILIHKAVISFIIFIILVSAAYVLNAMHIIGVIEQSTIQIAALILFIIYIRRLR